GLRSVFRTSSVAPGVRLDKFDSRYAWAAPDRSPRKGPMGRIKLDPACRISFRQAIRPAIHNPPTQQRHHAGQQARISKLSEVKMNIPEYSAQDLKKLPLRAIAALAARCARRVEHLTLLPDSHPESDG